MLAKLAILLEYHTWVRDGGLKRKMFGMSGGGHKGHLVHQTTSERQHADSILSIVSRKVIEYSQNRNGRLLDCAYPHYLLSLANWNDG
jgi:hypothetical protein